MPAQDAVLSHPLPAPQEGPWTRVLWIDFGPPERRASGAVAIDAVARYDEGGWTEGMVRTVRRAPAYGPYYSDLVEGEHATFVLGVEPAPRYRVMIQFGDPGRARGPADVRVNGRTSVRGIATEAGEIVDIIAEVPGGEGSLRVELDAGNCGSFGLVGLAVYRETASPRPLRPVFPKLEAALVRPEPLERDPGSLQRVRELLRSQCEYLLAHRPVEGCFAPSGNWYETAFPLRALLAGARILGEPAYLPAVFECLDRFVEEQHADGRWSAQFFGHPGCPLALETAREAESANLADVGTVALCLALAADSADEPRRSLYLERARLYADRIVLPSQMPDGAFPNLRYQGRDYRYPYSVATGVQAANLSALHLLTGEESYRAAAERAALFLAAGCREDGKIAFYSHESPTVIAINPADLGDFFYVVEGMVWAARVAHPEASAAIRRGLDRFFCGPLGLATWEKQDVWWYPKQPWEESKRAGLLYLLNTYRASGPAAAAIDPILARVSGAMLDPRYASQFGVGGDPASPRGRFALAATGMAGLGAATFLETASVFPAASSRR